MTTRNGTTQSSLRLSAALLSLDKRTHRHVKTVSGVSDFARFELVKEKNVAGSVQIFDENDPKIERFAHVATTQFPVVFKAALLTYGKGTIAHPAFAGRSKFAELTTEFYLAVRDLTVAGITVLGKSKDRFFVQHDDTLKSLFAPFGTVKEVMNLICDQLTAMQNALANGGLSDGYDARTTVFNGKITPYGQYIIDNGKRHDTALVNHFAGKAEKKPATAKKAAGKGKGTAKGVQGELELLPEEQKAVGKIVA